uniref:Collagen alpha-1(XXI) chain n=1 Tax=Leptobrachium leishanense TaxID=445787 RepID=A0A8C5PXM3_9ANUR
IPIQTTPVSCRTAPNDLVFILDGSWSVGPENFEILKKWVVNITSNFDIGPKYTQVGVVQYSDYPVLEIPLGSHVSSDDLIPKMQSIQYLGGNTRTGNAIQFAIDNLFARSLRPLTKIAIVLTDGKSQDDVKDIAEEARRNKITLFAIGVSSEIEESELRAIANKPSSTYVFYVEDYIAISRIREVMKQKLCEESVCPTRIPVAARDEKGFDILLGLGMNKKNTKRIEGSIPRTKAYEVTFQTDLTEFTRNVFPEGLPPSYVFVSTQRFKIKKKWDLWRIVALDGTVQTAVSLNGEDRTLSFTTTSHANDTQVVTFNKPGVKKLFDEGWHQIRILVTEADTTLYVDDEEIETRKLLPAIGIYISGKTQIGKYTGREETVQFSLQKLRIYCDPEQNKRETACEIPGMCLNGPSDVGSTPAPCICPPGDKGPSGPKVSLHSYYYFATFLPYKAHLTDSECFHSPSYMLGMMGDKGVTGLPGSQGYTGIPGSMGVKVSSVYIDYFRLLHSQNCSKGEMGEMGLQGFDGQKGEPGSMGLVGTPGPRGISGDRGPPGLPGHEGRPGREYSEEFIRQVCLDVFKAQLPTLLHSERLQQCNHCKAQKGSPGLPGSPGSVGQDGPIGQPGSPGRNGFPGLMGHPGRPGVHGPKGLPGKPGAKGNKGDANPGIQGSPGMPGPVGPPGFSKEGRSGQPGPPGRDGERGSPGSQGRPGEPGMCDPSLCFSAVVGRDPFRKGPNY